MLITCTRCHTPKDTANNEFDRDSTKVSGFRKICRSCRRANDPRKAKLGLHPGIAAEFDAPVSLAEMEVPEMFQSLLGNPEFEALLAEKPGKPDPLPRGVKGPKAVIPDKAQQLMLMILVVSDVHIPDQDKPFWRALLKFITDVKPNETILSGDFMELESCSQHGGANLVMLAHDIAAGNAALDALQGAAPGMAITYLEGNHETRLGRFLSSKAPSLIGSIGLPAALKLADRGIPWVPEDQQPIARGTLDILHGHQMGTGKSQSLPKFHANRALEVYGQANRTVTYGHTHKPQTLSLPCMGGVKRAVGLGCGRTLKPGWLHGSEAGWEHEFGVAYVHPNGKTDYYQIKVSNGSFYWAGKLYDGNVA